MSSSDLIALASLGVALAAFAVAIFALRRADLNASAQTLVSLTLGFKTAWRDFLSSDPAAQEFEFAEIFNLIEVASVTYLDRSIHGKSREILCDYLVNVMKIVADDPNLRQRITELRDDPEVFKYVKRFAIHMRRTGRVDEFSHLLFAKATAPDLKAQDLGAVNQA